MKNKKLTIKDFQLASPERRKQIEKQLDEEFERLMIEIEFKFLLFDFLKAKVLAAIKEKEASSKNCKDNNQKTKSAYLPVA